jgi:rhodanese-related sulfurtransferase
MKKFVLPLSVLLCLALFLSTCTNKEPPVFQLADLPPPVNDSGPFGIDSNINMRNIDDFLNRPDVAYFDMRMLYDPADFPAIGGIASLTQTLPGYRVVPFPFIANLGAMPVANAYDGDRLFEVVWGEGRGEVLEITPNFLESETFLHDIFPKDKVIFLMCGGAGYSSLARGLLIHMGWDADMIYHTGGNWHYDGNMSLDMTVSSDESNIATWRANYAFIDFNRLRRIVH